MSSAELIAALGKAIAELDAATRDAQQTSVMNLKPKLERVAALQSSMNKLLARGVADLAREVEAMKGGAHA